MANTKKYISLDKLGKYHGKLVELINSKDDVVLKGAKDYADSLATNYDAAGSATNAQAAVQANLDAEISRAKGEEAKNAAAAKKAQDEVDALEGVVSGVQAEVDALEGYVGTIPNTATAKDIVAYVQEKTAGIATDTALAELTGRVAQAETDIDNIEKDYLKASDKAELEGKIAEKASQSDLDAVSAVANAAATQTALQGEIDRAKGEEGRIEGLVTAEAARAAGVEAGLEGRLAEVETFFKLAEGEQLDTALDTLVEIQGYITSEGAAADKMVEDIAANKKAIEDHAKVDHDFAAADTTLKAELEGKIAEKASQTDLNTLSGKVTTAEGKISANESAITALQGEDTAIKGRLDALEGKFGEGDGSVEDMIADAKAEAISTAAGDATSKADAAESNAKIHATNLNTAMNARVEALEAVDHEHENKDLLDTYTQTEDNLADAVAKKHAHANADVLDGITSAKVTAWDGKADQTALAEEITRAKAAEKANADAIAAFVEASEEEVLAIFNA